MSNEAKHGQKSGPESEGVSTTDDLGHARTDLPRIHDEGMTGILRKVHPRHVIWALLSAILLLLGFIGRKYDGRLEALEVHRKEQNGHLNKIDVKLGEMEVRQELMYVTIQEIKEAVKK